MSYAEEGFVDWVANPREAPLMVVSAPSGGESVLRDSEGKVPDWNEVSDRVAAMRERFVDSPHRCPDCGKTMIRNTFGHRDKDDSFHAYTRHACLSCEEAAS